MPPSPSLRFSPGRDRRVDNHKRGRSLEGGLFIREKDDDLDLFNDMQTKESDNFLLDSNDDDSLTTKLRSFSSFNLGISIPVRGESSDLLNADEEKNDYDWLLTPPETPLFPSLDDETPPDNLVQRGRPRSQPISVSRATTAEKSYRSSRSSASPHRLSQSPRSGNNTLQSRGRPSSASHSSPSPILRPSTPTRRPSTPPIKPSTPVQRSSTPTSRKINIGSSNVTSTGRRGGSPVNTSRGSSASPKMSSWQSNIPGFSSDVPPNLRTSLADRPASYVRGSSPASRNGRDSSSKFGRQSLSPTASRSACSSNSFDRDRLSSHSKGSMASSGDDDIESLQSTNVSISEHSVTKKIGGYPHSRVLMSSRKPSRTILSSSVPKRSFDSALRPMDQKSPQNMFRPLLSSVPSTAFYAGKANASHRSMISINSSITTSSNASSEQSASVAIDTEESDHEQDDTAVLRETMNHDAEDEVFIFDKVDETNADGSTETFDENQNIGQHGVDGDSTCEVELSESATATAAPPPQSFYVAGDHSEVHSHERSTTCAQCGRKFSVVELVDEHKDICPDCISKSACTPLDTSESIPALTQNDVILSELTLEEAKIYEGREPIAGVPEFPEARRDAEFVQSEMNVEQSHSCLIEGEHLGSLLEEENYLVGQQVVDDPTVSSSQSHSEIADLKLSNTHSLNIDASEGAGISLLLRRSSSSKWPVVQGRPFTATNISCEGPSYARDNLNSMKNSVGHGSTSTSFSIDLSSSKHSEHRFHRQSSGRKDNMGNSRHDVNVSLQSSSSSFSGGSSMAYQTVVLAKSISGESCDSSVGNGERKGLRETSHATGEQCGTTENAELDYRDSSFTKTGVLDRDKLDHAATSRAMNVSPSQLSSPTISIRFEEIRESALPSSDCCLSSRNAEDHSNSSRSICDMEVLAATPDSTFIEEDSIQNSGFCGGDIIEVYTRELENRDGNSHGSQSCCGHSQDSKTINDEQDPPAITISEKDASVAATESEETSVMVECSTGGHHTRSLLTLEEATDTILFCRSIVHDLAYDAAALGFEKENAAYLEKSLPIIIPSGKSTSDRKDQRGRNITKRTPKSQKVKPRRVETEAIPLPISSETDSAKTNDASLSQHDSAAPRKVDSRAPVKLESKCNCTVM